MKYANEAFFLAYALILLGIFISSIPYLRKNQHLQPNNYWLIALAINIVSFVLFAIASLTNLFLLTLANTLFVGAYVYLAIFFRSLNQKPVEKLARLAPIFILFFGAIFEVVRQLGTFQNRVTLVLTTLGICLVFGLNDLIQLRRSEKRIQLDFLITTVAVELILVLIRLTGTLMSDPSSATSIYEEPLINAAIRAFTIAFTVLSYVSILGYWGEKLILENAEQMQDSLKVSRLLAERDAMISSLLMANKSSVTEAISASIAHELNQPLGASLLNIQFMKMLHDANKLTPVLIGDLINQLERDAKRAGDIVKSLQSIFIKDEDAFEVFATGEVIDSALAIYKSELISNSIQLKLHLDYSLTVKAHKGQFLQVLLNLINNAMQILGSANPERKIITIVGSQVDDHCIIRVMDSGPGLSKDRREYLFELFGSDKQSGMGVGLWLCSYIMNNFGGRIAYEDNPEGGAIFIVSLPKYSPEG
ncbi:hypothetical protein ICN19_08200 [Polynucleobacter sp. AP-Capit-er-40B-B4]|uniref:sensor histidine kinase n=1 Tax=Polynucleobacter sp. AP-Capit-er-40B-B4 TaxID=2576927 RepID=UPI001C0BE853|nr:HAMP domain-containing sensor histidine kinase [Polynucleobacter sp. AP-Capit-er-40B-B4]MBU3581997.1 hypothetical protein [Polynucleobacter sp. AP-Capit-er-40B-B4]